MKIDFMPVKIRQKRIQHVRKKSGRGHITPEDIVEVLQDPNRSVYKNKRRAAADYVVKGQTQSGKRLTVCVKLLPETEFYSSDFITAWES